MTDLSLDLKNSIADLQTRHAALITAVQTYRNGSVGSSKAEITAAAAALETRLNTEESALLGLAGRGVQPSLSMDFMKDMYLMGDTRPKNGYNFADLITFTRASIGTSFNSAGTLVSNAVNTPRFDYDPVTKVLKGLLIEEGRTNQVSYSESLDKWVKTKVTVIPNAAVAPDGTLNACKLVNTSENAWHILSSAPLNITSGWQYTISVYAKAAELPRVRICFNDNTVFNASSVFDLTTGTRVSGTVGNITPVGNGWYRVTFIATAMKASTTVGMAMNAVKAGEVDANSASDDVSGIYIWGAQCEAGAMETSYVPTPPTFTGRTSTATSFNSSGVMQTAVAGAARSDAYGYDSAGVLKPIGLLLESAATNLCPRSNEFTSGLWSKGANTTFSTDGTLAPNGALATKVTLTGTTSHDVSIAISALTIGQPYTLSLWIKPNAYIPSLQLAYYDAGVNVNGGTATMQVVGEWRRCTYTFTPTVTPTAPRIRLIGFSGGGDALSFYMFNCQMEQGLFPTSDIITAASEAVRSADVSSSAQVTRAHDVASVNTMSPWFNSREGTLTAEFSQRTPPITGTFRRVTALTGPNLDEIAIYMSGAAGMMNSFVRALGVVQNDAPAPGAVALAVDEVRRAAVAYKENDLSFSTLGLSGSDTTVILPTGINSLIIGGNGTNLQRWCGHMRTVRYYPVRLTTAQIKVLSA